MTSQEKDKFICEKLGVCWHEWVTNYGHDSDMLMCKHCWEYPREVNPNPDFTSEAGRVQLLKLMIKHKDWKNFVWSLGFSYFTQSLCAQLLEDYFADDTGKFRDAVYEWLGGEG